MKNSNQKKNLGITLLILALFLSITSCNKDETITEFEQSEITLHKAKEIFNSNFNRNAFPNLKNEPLWEYAKTYFVNNRQYIEIPFTDITKFNLKKSTSVSIDKLIAFISPDEKPTLNVVHYYAQDIQTHFPNFDKILYFDLKDFNGFATLYDLDKNVINSNKYSSGVKSDYQYIVKNKNENDDNLFYRMPEDCEMHTETIVTESCWFWIYNDGSVEIIDCYYDYEYITYETCESQGGGGSGTTVITEENQLDEFEITTINLDNCSKAIFDSIKESNPMEKIILQFSGDNTSFNWTLETTNESTFENTSNSAETNWLNGSANNYITKIGTNYKNTATKLSLARTIVHEAIHAYMLSYIDIAQTNPQAAYKEFPELWNDMVAKKYGVPNDNLEQYQHEEMARNYVSSISSALAKWDNNQQSNQYYEDIAWGGLFETDAFQQSSDLSNTDRIRISNVNNAEDSNSSNSKSNPCN